MPYLPIQPLDSFRRRTFRLDHDLKLKNQQDAIDFVNERGFVFFWPIKGIRYPSLWSAVAGDRPVADAHDDPGHVTWGWKDSLLGKRAWYYGKILRKKATMISLEIAPFFYALSENYGAPEEDYLTQYEQGRMTQEAKALYEALLDHSPLDTVVLRKAIHMTSPDSDSRFERALADLQADFKIMPVAVTDSGAWKYAFAYDIVPRHLPHLPEAAQKISEREARRKLAELYFLSNGAGRTQDLVMLFSRLPVSHWKTSEVEATLTSLCQSGFLVSDVDIETESGKWFVLANLLA
jgi:hypothetical protein